MTGIEPGCSVVKIFGVDVKERILCFGFTFRAILTFEGMYERLRLIIVRKAFGCFRLVLGIGKPSITFDNHVPLDGLDLHFLQFELLVS